MNPKRWVILFAMVLLLIVGRLAWPVYEFYAHRGAAPLSPFGWHSIDGDVPATQEAFDPRFDEAGSRALELMEEHRSSINAPALSAALAVDGELVWVGAVGYADIETEMPATPETIFRIGSTSKAITGTTLARLVERGEMNLDAPLSSYMAELPNESWANITPRQLASHSSGLPHYKENGDLLGLYQTIALDRHYDDVRDALAVFDESPLLFEPGTDFFYSSLGTVLLGAVMSEVTGVPYRQLVQREVIEPAAMTSTFSASDSDRRADRLATFYYTDEGRHREWRDVDLSQRLPGGGFASTPSDLARLGAMYFDEDYLALQTRETFWSPQRLADGEVNEQNYAIGWRWREWDIEGVGIARNANHGGVSRGSQCWLLVFVDYTMSMAFCTNRKTEEFIDFGILYESLLRAFAPVGSPPSSP